MKRKYKIVILLILLVITSFLAGLNFYKNEDVNHDGKVDIKDLLVVQKYILERDDINGEN